jgi:sec-independent protein translocase protein TatA
LVYNDLGETRKFKKNEGAPSRGAEGVPMGMPGPWELIIILLIVVMIFGAKRIPEIMGGIGKGIKTFKKTMEGEDEPTTPPSESTPPESKETPKEEKGGSD